MPGGGTWSCTAAVAAAIALCPWAAAAQTSAAAGVAPGSRSQEVDLIANLIYSTNVAGVDDTVAHSRGLTRADEIFEPRIHFEVARPFGRETAYVTGDAGYDFYAHNKILNRENLDISPGVLGQIGPCQTGLTGEYSRAQRDLAELAATPTGLAAGVDQKDTLQVEQIGGNAACVRSTGIGPSVTASETWVGNSATIERFTNAQTFSGSGGLTYQRPVLGSVRVFGAYSHTDYPDRAGLVALIGAGVSTGYRTVSGGVSYTRAVGSRLQGSLSVSYTDLTSSGSSSPGFSGLTYSAALTYRVSSRLTTSAVISRETVPSNRLNSTYAIDETFDGQAAYELSSRLSLMGGVSYAQDDYGGTPSPIMFDLTKQKIYTAFGSANLKLTRRFSFALDVRHLQRTANFAGLSYSETRLGLTTRASF